MYNDQQFPPIVIHMKTFLSIKYHSDQTNQSLIEDLMAVLSRAGLVPTCVAVNIERWGDVKFTAEELMKRTFAEIDSCELFIVDLSEKGVGVGIEVGYAYCRCKPVWVIAHSGSDISPTLAGIANQVFFYSNPQELSDILKPKLNQG
jgi:2'-deoxynucleoside 5'-phosphate N-hydrolase